MAVEDTTTSTEAEEAVDTSVDTDESTDDNEDVDLEDIEVTEEELSGEESEEKSEEETDESSEEESDESQEETEEAELSDEDKQKAFNNEMAQQRIQEKEARIARVQQDQANYIAEAGENRDPLELAVRQLQVTEYNNAVEAATNKLTNGYERAINDFEVLKNASPEIQAEIDQTIDAFQAMHVAIDAYGNPTQVTGDLYATLQAKADSIEKLTGIRSTNQDKSKTKEKSKTLTTPSRAPKEAKVDPDMAAFDEEASK